MMASPVTLQVKNPPGNTEDTRDIGSAPWLGRSPREGNGNPLQYSWSENSKDRKAWWPQPMGSQGVGHHWACIHTWMMEGFPWLWGGDGKQYFYWAKKKRKIKRYLTLQRILLFHQNALPIFLNFTGSFFPILEIISFKNIFPLNWWVGCEFLGYLYFFLVILDS